MKPETLTADMTTLGASRTLAAPTLTKACVIRADIGPALEFRTTQGTTRAVFPIIGARRLAPAGAAGSSPAARISRWACPMDRMLLKPATASNWKTERPSW